MVIRLDEFACATPSFQREMKLLSIKPVDRTDRFLLFELFLFLLFYKLQVTVMNLSAIKININCLDGGVGIQRSDFIRDRVRELR